MPDPAPGPTIISCLASDWMDRVRLGLREGVEVELTDFRYLLHGAFCEMAAAAYGMSFTADIQKGTGRFWKRS